MSVQLETDAKHISHTLHSNSMAFAQNRMNSHRDIEKKNVSNCGIEFILANGIAMK